MLSKPHTHSKLQAKVTDLTLPMRWASTSSGELCCQVTALVVIFFTAISFDHILFE